MTTSTYYPTPTRTEPRNGFAITALVLAIVGLVFSVIPLTGFIAVILGAVGLLFGLLNIGRIRRGVSTARKMTWLGSFFAAAALLIGFIGMVMVFQAVDQLDKDLACIDQAKTVRQMDRC